MLNNLTVLYHSLPVVFKSQVVIRNILTADIFIMLQCTVVLHFGSYTLLFCILICSHSLPSHRSFKVQGQETSAWVRASHSPQFPEVERQGLSDELVSISLLGSELFYYAIALHHSSGEELLVTDIQKITLGVCLKAVMSW